MPSGIIRRSSLALVTAIVMVVITQGYALAQPSITTWVDPIDETFVDVNCGAGPDEVHIVGWERVRVMETGTWFSVHVTFWVQQSWTDSTTGEAFTGIASGPFSFRVTPAGGEVYSDVFTAIATGDQGTHALFTFRGHATVDANGNLAVEWFSESGGCW